MNTRIAVLGIGLSSLLIAPASAAIVGVTGGVTQLGIAPPSCLPGALMGFTAFAWDEKQNVALTLAVDMVNNPGSSNGPDSRRHSRHLRQPLSAL